MEKKSTDSNQLNNSTERIASPDGKKTADGTPLMVMPPKSLLAEKYSVSYLTAGGMGAIYLAVDINSSEKFIIKEAFSKNEAQKEEFKDALKREKEILEKSDHPGIVKFIDFFIEKDIYYLVIEYIEGRNLKDYQKSISKKEIDEEKILFCGIALCKILTYLHSMEPPVIYRDLKPENIMVTPEGDIKLIDFGITVTGEASSQKDNNRFGTHGFSAPEQYGGGAGEIRSDIYSLGATLHYMATSRNPGESEDLFIFPPVREINPEISEELEEIISKATEIDQEKRFASAEELENSLRKLCASISVKPGFIKFGEIIEGRSKNFELNISNRGKGTLKGKIVLPEAIAGLKADREVFTGEGRVNFQLDTAGMTQNENYSDNIVIFSSGGNAYIPLSFKIIQNPAGLYKEKLKPLKLNKDKLKTKIVDISSIYEEEPAPLKPLQDKWKTKIVDISPEPPPDEKVKEKTPPLRKKTGAFIWTALILSIIILIFFGTAKYLKENKEKKNILKENLKSLSGYKICFTGKDRDDYNIFSVNPDGTQLKNLTKNNSKNSEPCWSPDGKNIAFSTNRDGRYKIYVMNEKGENPTLLTDKSKDMTSPSWSPDGEKIAFQCFYNNNNEIFTMKNDGTRLLNITRNNDEDFSPSWSPDGNYIAFESKRDKVKDDNGVITREIYIMKPDGSGALRITENNSDDFSPRWSPDSNSLVFVSNINNNYDIYTVNIDGTERLNITSSKNSKENYPCWLPGGKILYGLYKETGLAKVTGKEYSWEIHIMNEDGTGKGKLLNFGGKNLNIYFPREK